MKVLVACEESQRVTIEFRKLGHQAYSCDLLDCSGNHPEWHIKKDVTVLLNGNCIFHTVDGAEHEISGKWDMIIAFPPCTYLSVVGNRWFNFEKYGDKAIQRMLDRNDAIKFFMTIANADCDKIAIENPVGIMSTHWRKPDQIIQPYQFGDAYEKRTCLWLKGLPNLIPTKIVDIPDRVQFKSGKTMAKWYAEAVHLPKEQRALVRSKTFLGIAKAMATQWGAVEKHYADYTSDDFIKAGIENAECARGNDVFDGCKKSQYFDSEIIKYAMSKIGTKRVSTLDGMTLEYKNKYYNIYVDDNNVTVEELEETEENSKEVMEVKQELNARFGKEQYFDTDSLQPNKTIIEKIENINHCPNQNTCCIVSPFVHCDYKYKSDSCIKAHKNFIYHCEQVHKQMKARSNPEWHHVNLETVRNIDIDMLDEKRRNYMFLYHLIKDFRKYAFEIKREDVYFDLVSNVLRNIQQLYFNNVISHKAYKYATRHIQAVGVEKGYFMSEREETFGFKESRRYNRIIR